MKKITTILACIVTCCVAFTFAACFDDTHNYSQEWSYDEDYHFRKCTDENCTAVTDKSAHTFDNGTVVQEATYTDDETTRYTCTVCAYYYDEKTGDKIEYTTVTTVDELTTALQNGETAVLMNDIVLQDGANIVIDKACVLDGNGHKITARGELPDNYRVVNVTAKDCEATVKNVNIEVEYSQGQFVSYLRGINFSTTSNLVFNVDNVTLTLPDYYALNITLGNTNLTLNVTASTIKGWAAVNNFSSRVTFNAKQSTFIGKNIHASPNNSSNYFTTIVAAGYIVLDSSDQEFAERNLSAFNNFTFDDCTITALIEEVDGTPIDTVQYVIDLRSPFGNTVSLNDCQLNFAGTATKILSAFDSAYIPEENRNDTTFVINTNKVFIDGVDVTDDTTKVDKYLDN